MVGGTEAAILQDGRIPHPVRSQNAFGRGERTPHGSQGALDHRQIADVLGPAMVDQNPH